MQNGKYVPPHLRGGAHDDNSRSSWAPRRDRPGPDNYEQTAPQPMNARWSDSRDGPRYDSRYRDDGRRSEAGRPGRRGFGRTTRRNELGFHGDMNPSPHLEARLFDRKDAQQTGINFDRYDDIPIETSEGCPRPYEQFSVEIVGEQLMKNLALCQFTKPTPVQKYSIPIGVAGRDMMACAQTGSGKTAGFLFPVISLLLRNGAPEALDTALPDLAYPVALILAPTRELASQIFDEAQKFCYCTGLRPVVVYGGADIRAQKRELDRGCDILVATPGRLVDLIERGYIRLDAIQFLVLDEADRMLDMGFEPQIRRIVQEEGMPASRQTFMFSATFPRDIQRLAGDFMKDYVFLAVGRVGSASQDVIQQVDWVEDRDKLEYLIDFLHRAPKDGLILVFCETKRGADWLENVLFNQEFPACSIHGDKNQREREDALRCFKSGHTPILVATDVAARGLDIPNVTQVINFDLPSNIDDYVHRIGRTGRVGNVGHALSLMNDKNRNIARELAELLSEHGQECPSWLQTIGRSGGGRGGSSRGRGGRFGARDYRRDRGPDRESGPAPSRGGYSSGGRGGSGGNSGYSNSRGPSHGPSHGGYPPLSASLTASNDHGHGGRYQDNSAW